MMCAVLHSMTSTHRTATADDDPPAVGLSDNDGFLVPSPIPTRRTRTYSQYVMLTVMMMMMMMMMCLT